MSAFWSRAKVGFWRDGAATEYSKASSGTNFTPPAVAGEAPLCGRGYFLALAVRASSV